MVEKLLELGADPNIETDRYFTPLYWVFNNNENTAIFITDSLIEYGADYKKRFEMNLKVKDLRNDKVYRVVEEMDFLDLSLYHNYFKLAEYYATYYIPLERKYKNFDNRLEFFKALENHKAVSWLREKGLEDKKEEGFGLRKKKVLRESKDYLDKDLDNLTESEYQDLLKEFYEKDDLDNFEYLLKKYKGKYEPDFYLFNWIIRYNNYDLRGLPYVLDMLLKYGLDPNGEIDGIPILVYLIDISFSNNELYVSRMIDILVSYGADVFQKVNVNIWDKNLRKDVNIVIDLLDYALISKKYYIADFLAWRFYSYDAIDKPLSSYEHRIDYYIDIGDDKAVSILRKNGAKG
jgi:ankyrin repeat protein